MVRDGHQPVASSIGGRWKSSWVVCHHKGGHINKLCEANQGVQLFLGHKVNLKALEVDTQDGRELPDGHGLDSLAHSLARFAAVLIASGKGVRDIEKVQTLC